VILLLAVLALQQPGVTAIRAGTLIDGRSVAGVP